MQRSLTQCKDASKWKISTESIHSWDLYLKHLHASQAPVASNCIARAWVLFSAAATGPSASAKLENCKRQNNGNQWCMRAKRWGESDGLHTQCDCAARSHYDRYYFIRRHDNWRGALASALASLGAATAATALADSVSRWVTLVLASCAVHSFLVSAVSVRLRWETIFPTTTARWLLTTSSWFLYALRWAWNSYYRGKFEEEICI